MKKTIVVNLFAGPGAGKSTGAAWLFSKLKLAGVDAEYVNEFAKDKVWEGNQEAFKCQMFLSGKQAYKISRCYGKVDVIVTDSPIAIGAQYNTDNPFLNEAIMYEFGKYNNLNVLLKRVKEYNPNGRLQTESEARAVDGSTRDWLDKNSVSYIEAEGNEGGYQEVLEVITNMLIENNGKKTNVQTH